MWVKLQVKIKQESLGTGWYILPFLTMRKPPAYMTDDWVRSQVKRHNPEATDMQVIREYKV